MLQRERTSQIVGSLSLLERSARRPLANNDDLPAAPDDPWHRSGVRRLPTATRSTRHDCEDAGQADELRALRRYRS
jgi:hypothetical protein